MRVKNQSAYEGVFSLYMVDWSTKGVFHIHGRPVYGGMIFMKTVDCFIRLQCYRSISLRSGIIYIYGRLVYGGFFSIYKVDQSMEE